MKKVLYILIDSELDSIYGAVQGGHAIAQYLLEHTLTDWHNDYVVYLSCNIKEWLHKIDGYEYSIFREPDLNNKITAIAVRTDEKRLFKKLKLLE